MATSITNEHLEKAGYVFFSSYYANVRPKVIGHGTAVYHTAVWEVETGTNPVSPTRLLCMGF